VGGGEEGGVERGVGSLRLELVLLLESVLDMRRAFEPRGGEEEAAGGKGEGPEEEETQFPFIVPLIPLSILLSS
jgi:hypothetical protein